MRYGKYESFQEVAKSFGLAPVSKVTKDKEKLKSQQEKFSANHKCKACGEPMRWVSGTSIMACVNPKCKGISRTRKDVDGNEIVSYYPSYDLLDDNGAVIANNIFNGEA